VSALSRHAARRSGHVRRAATLGSRRPRNVITEISSAPEVSFNLLTLLAHHCFRLGRL
jgi:hypothetical protein